MPSPATFLHLTDTHLSLEGTTLKRDDHKVSVPDVRHDTREAALDLMLQRIGEKLAHDARLLDGVIFSGDALNQGKPGGGQLLHDMVLKHLAPLGITAKNIVAVPGNHDVPRGSPPGSQERYEPFMSVWRRAGSVTPWLDGVDTKFSDGGPHSLEAQDGSWAIYAVNSANWSHTSIKLEEPLSSLWPKIPGLIAGGDKELETTLKSQLESLARYDMARVSEKQLEAVRELIAYSQKPRLGRQLRVAVLHHHLRAPTMREELKPFADFTNLELLRTFLREQHIGIVIHGHKHEHAQYFDHIYDATGVIDHRVAIVSGATFGPGNELDAGRLITISGLPHVPALKIEPISIPRGGVNAQFATPLVRRLWRDDAIDGAPAVVQGSDINEVYDRACEIAATDTASGILIVHLDLPSTEELPFPDDYPTSTPDEVSARRAWFDDLVRWWQSERSVLEDRLPYLHGSRLRRYGGKFDQIERIISLLKERASTRAIAVLVDPFRDFTKDGQQEEFASFCLVEFKRQDLGNSRFAIDAIAFYRAQEFARWWPVNVAEIRFLQNHICSELKFQPGRITTIAADARTRSKTPTQVAMPIIDRWLDQAPERLHYLASAFATGRLPKGGEGIIGQWQQALTDLEQAAAEYNPDGMPVAIEGLDALASYLALEASTGGDIQRLVLALRRLSRANKTFDDGSKTKAQFDIWAIDARETIQELRKVSLGLVR